MQQAYHFNWFLCAGGLEGDDGDEDDEDQLGDLLACLGEEEQKVQILERKLVELGFDPGPLLVDLGGPDLGDDST